MEANFAFDFNGCDSLMCEDPLPSSHSSEQQSALIDASPTMMLRKWEKLIPITPPVTLDQCMHKIGEIRFSNLINNPMPHTSASTPTNMTNESLYAMLESSCDLFQITIKIIEYNGNISTDIDLTGELDQGSLPSNNQQQQQENCVFIVYNTAQQLFAPLSVRQNDGHVKLFLEPYEADIIEQKALAFLQNRISHEHQNSTVATNNTTDNEDSVVQDNQQSLMDHSGLIDQSSANDDQDVSSSSGLNEERMSTANPNNVHIVLKCILSSDREFQNYSGNNNQNEEENLVNLVQNYNVTQNLFTVAEEFARLFNIYLHFIAFDQGKYCIINNSFSPMNKEQSGRAFIVRDDKPMDWAFLCFDNAIGNKQCVVAFNDQDVTETVEKYIEQLTYSDSNLIQTNALQPVVEGSTDNAVMNNNSTEFTNLYLDSTTLTQETLVTDGRTTQQSIRTDDMASDSNLPLPSNQGSSELYEENQRSTNGREERFVPQTDIAQLNELGCTENNAQSSTATVISSSNILSSTTQDREIELKKPEMVVKTKNEWRIQYPKDLIPNSNGRKSASLLQGEGDQRSRITVKTSLEENTTTYLAIDVRTIENQPHPSKIIVPEKTEVNGESFNGENNLNYFKFGGCDSIYFRDPDTGIIYVEITPEKHPNGLVKVAIYMFKLYQTQRLTKEMIESDQLDQCKLAFWSCIKKEGKFVKVSPELLSGTIIEKERKNNNSR